MATQDELVTFRVYVNNVPITKELTLPKSLSPEYIKSIVQEEHPALREITSPVQIDGAGNHHYYRSAAQKG